MTFPIGSDSISCADIDIIDDDDLEGDHDFVVEITAVGDNAMINDMSITTVTIMDDEGQRI